MTLLKRLKESKDVKTLASNFISLSLLQIAGYIFPLLTVPYLAHVLGVDLYGEIAFASAVMIYFQTLVDYGFIFSSVRDIARCRDNKIEVSKIYSEVMWTRGFLMFCAFILLIILILAVPKCFEMRWLLIASFLMVIGHTLFPDWIFQGLERMKYITIFNIAIKLFFTLAVFIFIRTPADYLLQPILTALGYIISGIGSIWLINRWGIKLHSTTFSVIKSRLKNNFDLFLNQIIPNLYNSASILYLGFIHGDVANGIYDAANRFNTVGSSLFSIISRTFYPFLSRRMDKHTLFRNLNLIIASLIAIGLFVTAPFIIHTFFPSDFNGAIITLRIISVSLIFLAISNIYGTNFLIINGYEKELRIITLYSSLIGFAIAIPSVYYLSYIGVALTVATSRGILGFWSMIKAIKIRRLLSDNVSKQF